MAKDQKLICEWCGADMSDKPLTKKGTIRKFCSRECSKTYLKESFARFYKRGQMRDQYRKQQRENMELGTLAQDYKSQQI